jgi:hypothetical protein
MKRLIGIIFAVCVLSWPCAGAEREAPLNPLIRKTVFAQVDAPSGKVPSGMYRQFLSMLGREDMFANKTDPTFPRRPPVCTPETEGGAARDAVEAVVARAQGQRLVIINEAHDEPLSRAFIMDVMLALHRTGVSILAAETFFRKIEAQGPRYPKLSDGFYSMEPAYGEIIRRARIKNMLFIPYETEVYGPDGAPVSEQIAVREAGQTRNLMERLIKPYPNARAFIFVGHSHVFEAPDVIDGRETVWMAARLKRESGIDPLTIDVTKYLSPIERPVLCASASRPGASAPLTDLAVGLPALTLRDGRPAWRQARGQKPIAVPKSLRAKERWTIIEARHAFEPDEAVPVDRLLLGPGEKLPLLLPTGEFRIDAWSREAGWTKAETVVVR